MSIFATDARTPRLPMRLRSCAEAPLAWCLLAALFLVASTLLGPGPSLMDWLGDTDDAVRLVMVREFLAGAPWFDTTVPRIGAPSPLVSHWSRLIDLPLAGLIALATPIFGSGGAELATRTVWPALLYLALAFVVVREVHRRAGPWAAAAALVLIATSVTALAQFRPGRIDHHNAMILCTVAGLLLLIRSLEAPRLGWTAGALLGLALAIGYEPLALVIPAFGLAALVALLRPERGAGVARAAVAATAVLFAAVALTIPPARWLDVHCDALSLNLAVLALPCAAALWAALAVRGHAAVRFAIAGLGLGTGAVLYAALEPACLAGPFGQVDAAVAPIWLDHVLETKSILYFAAHHPGHALGLVAFVTAGAAAQVLLWHRSRDAGHALAAGILVLAAALGCWQVKLMPYACWLCGAAACDRGHALARHRHDLGAARAHCRRHGA